MKKIRIPRKLKKKYSKLNSRRYFPNVPVLLRYYHYFFIEEGIKRHSMSAEDLVHTFGAYVYDDVIWWNWVRLKELGIKPEMSTKFQEYWNYFVERGIIKK